MSGKYLEPTHPWRLMQVMGYQHAGGSQTIGSLLSENRMQIHLRLKGKKHRQSRNHQQQIQEEPAENFDQ
jgi:hypothetical protein